jgi:hypothetical protein
LEYIAEPIVIAKGVANNVKLNQLNEILVGNLFVHRYFSPLPFFLLISPILQMVNRRNRNVNAENNNATNNNAENNNAANLPLTLEQVLMMQAQMLQTMQQTMVNMQNAQPQAPHHHQEIDLETFSAPSRLLSLISWNSWMLMTGSRL